MIDPKNITTISDLRFKTDAVLKQAQQSPVFVFKRTTPQGVLISYEEYEQMKSSLEDYYLSVKTESYEQEDKEQIKWTKHQDVKKLLGLWTSISPAGAQIP